MRARVIVIVICLLLGMVVNIAAAWVFALYAPLHSNEEKFNEGHFTGWDDRHVDWYLRNYPFEELVVPVKPPPRPSLADQGLPAGTRVTYAPSDSMSGWGCAEFDYLRISAYHPPSAGVTRVRSGLPFRSMTAASWWKVSSDSSSSEERMIGGMVVEVRREADLWNQVTFLMGPRILPFQPIWPGFLLNTVIYAVPFWLLATLPFQWRARRRRRRGWCVACAYPMGSSPVCTECGAVHRGHPSQPLAERVERREDGSRTR